MLRGVSYQVDSAADTDCPKVVNSILKIKNNFPLELSRFTEAKNELFWQNI